MKILKIAGLHFQEIISIQIAKSVVILYGKKCIKLHSDRNITRGKVIYQTGIVLQFLVVHLVVALSQ